MNQFDEDIEEEDDEEDVEQTRARRKKRFDSKMSVEMKTKRGNELYL